MCGSLTGFVAGAAAALCSACSLAVLTNLDAVEFLCCPLSLSLLLPAAAAGGFCARLAGAERLASDRPAFPDLP